MGNSALIITAETFIIFNIALWGFSAMMLVKSEKTLCHCSGCHCSVSGGSEAVSAVFYIFIFCISSQKKTVNLGGRSVRVLGSHVDWCVLYPCIMHVCSVTLTGLFKQRSSIYISFIHLWFIYNFCINNMQLNPWYMCVCGMLFNRNEWFTLTKSF